MHLQVRCTIPVEAIRRPCQAGLLLAPVSPTPAALQDPEAVATFLLLQCMWNQDFQVGSAGQHQLLSGHSR